MTAGEREDLEDLDVQPVGWAQAVVALAGGAAFAILLVLMRGGGL